MVNLKFVHIYVEPSKHRKKSILTISDFKHFFMNKEY